MLYTALLPSITPEMPSRAPRGSARVMLLGGPGSRAEELGEALTAAYGAVLVSAPQLLRAAALSGTVHGMKVKPYLDKGELAMVPDKLVRGIVLARLQHKTLMGAWRSWMAHARAHRRRELDEKAAKVDALERLQTLAKNETFQAKVQQMTKDPSFAAAAGQYANEMADEVIAEHEAAADSPSDDLGFGDTLDDDDDDDDEV